MENDLHIAICEDSRDDALLLQGYVAESGIPARCERFEDGAALLNSFHAGRYDIIFHGYLLAGLGWDRGRRENPRNGQGRDGRLYHNQPRPYARKLPPESAGIFGKRFDEGLGREGCTGACPANAKRKSVHHPANQRPANARFT